MRLHRFLRSTLLALTYGALAVCPACGDREAPRVVSVIRTDHVQYAGVGDEWPGDRQRFVLLLIKVDGLRRQALDSIPKREVYLMADGERSALKLIGFSTSVSTSGEVAGGSVELLAGVPRATLRFTLHLGSRPPLDVVVSDTTIRPEVRRPE